MIRTICSNFKNSLIFSTNYVLNFIPPINNAHFYPHNPMIGVSNAVGLHSL